MQLTDHLLHLFLRQRDVFGEMELALSIQYHISVAFWRQILGFAYTAVAIYHKLQPQEFFLAVFDAAMHQHRNAKQSVVGVDDCCRLVPFVWMFRFINDFYS